jgi:putative inorganic carbon (hco3(-)) transporter
MLDLFQTFTITKTKALGSMYYQHLLNTTRVMCILAFLLLITFSPSVHLINYIEYHDCQRVIQLLLLALVLMDAMFLGWKKTSLMPINKEVRFGFFALLALTIASSVQAIAPRYAVIEVTVFVALCYLALFVARLYRENGEVFIKQLCYALWASIALYMVSFYTGYITAILVKKTLAWPYPFYGFSNIRLFQQYQLWTLGLICLPLLAFDLKKNSRLWLYVALANWWVLLFYAASRGVTLGWIVAMFATALIYKKSAWPFLRIQLITAFVGLCAYQLLFKMIPSWIATTATVASSAGSTVAASASASNAIVTSTIFRDTFTDRTDLWKVALVMVKNFPFLGVGPMHFYHYNNFGTHPHNSVLQLASEWGLPATLIIVTITGYALYCWMKKFNVRQLQSTTKPNSNLAIILFFTIAASSAYSLVEGVIVMPISQVLMFTMIGLMIGQYTEKTWLVGNTKSVKNKLGFRPVFAGVVLVFMILSTTPELVRGLTSSNRFLAIGERAFSVGPGINPRIWMQQRREN